jgi:hypothetical protein
LGCAPENGIIMDSIESPGLKYSTISIEGLTKEKVLSAFVGYHFFFLAQFVPWLQQLSNTNCIDERSRVQQVENEKTQNKRTAAFRLTRRH